MPKGAMFKKKCKKVLFNGFVMIQFPLFDPTFFPCKKGKILMHFSKTYLISIIKSELHQIEKNYSRI